MTVPAGDKVDVDVTLTGPSFQPRIFGGWITFTRDGAMTPELSVPYAGIRGDFQSRSVFGHDAYGLPVTDFYSAAWGTIDVSAFEFAAVFFNLGIQAEELKFTVHRVAKDGVSPGKRVGPIEWLKHTWRNANEFEYDYLLWFGDLADGSFVPDGTYVIVTEALRAGGDEAIHLETHVSPPITVVNSPGE